MPTDAHSNTRSPTPNRLRISTDLAERILLVTMLSSFAARISMTLDAQPWNIVIVLSEAFTVLLVIFRKPGAVAGSPYAWMVAFVGTFTPLLVIPNGHEILSPEIGTALMTGGLLISVLAKIYLNRSFGIVAANRGVKSKGPYRLVRHPMYLGYLISQIGFLTLSMSAVNIAFYAVAWAAQILRMREEEAFLMQDPLYQAFAARVRYRIIPGIY